MNTKLNSLVAEKVMGWNTRYLPSAWPGSNGEEAWWFDGENSIHEHEAWEPSSDLNDALAALEKAANDRSWHIGKWTNKPCTVQYWAQIHNAQGGYGPAAAIAICKCALSESGVSDSEIQSALKEE